jgi:cytochrome c5
MNIEVKALIGALLISGTVVGSFLGTARVVQSSTPMRAGKRVAQSAAIKDPKVSAGAKLFALNCAHCHGIDATGDEGPDLHKVTKTDERIKSLILKPTLLTAEQRKMLDAVPQSRPTSARRTIGFTDELSPLPRFCLSLLVIPSGELFIDGSRSEELLSWE